MEDLCFNLYGMKNILFVCSYWRWGAWRHEGKKQERRQIQKRKRKRRIPGTGQITTITSCNNIPTGQSLRDQTDNVLP